MKKEATKYTIRMLAIFAFYTVSVIGINLLPADDMAPWMRIALSLIPVIPAIVMIFVILEFVRAMDEVQQRIITESCLVSLVVVGLASFSYGFLEGAIDVPPISMIWVFPALIGTAGIAQIFVRMRYR
ncbi:hypothetical protein [Aquisalinus flavus]|uniref:Transmembrane protein n=1 Tax=Aquisalinus flavus TaxID=1526572 RepID=A0A8J2Y5W1_9PROT|nr:hypothetical protein [Aquisalinus flavus]MBD0426741.1 hypothetical protein [Aquisalinus flavus]UNE46601.1 hypothetical protein FF099_00255 [Aquisalinus flavus]GGC95611.1 hypothetical protein GCM10011342_00510 [Aquisalinus flavus]